MMNGRVAIKVIVVTGFAVVLPSYSTAAAVTNPPAALEQFGPPTEGYQATDANLSCYGYQVAGHSAPVKMGGAQFLHGFQVSVSRECAGRWTWTWTWHLAGRYSGFSGCVGLAAGDTQPATLSFVGHNGSPILFEADGQQVRSTTLVAGLPTFVKLGTVHLMNLIIRTGTAGASIGFGNDGLFVGDIPVRECG